MPKNDRRSANPSYMIATARELSGAAYHLLSLERPNALPAQILFALSIEVMLKAASQIERRSYLATHNLMRLFNDLPPEARSKVVAQYDHLAAIGVAEHADVPFEDRLQRLSNDFVEARYAFESPPEPGQFQYFEVPDLLANVIWRGLVGVFRKVPNARVVQSPIAPSGSEFTRYGPAPEEET